MTRKGDWMQTFTGRQFWPLDPRPEEVDPRDIAHALSLICRYGGHTRRFYSVAEHCVKISETLEDRDLALWALLHDATEAYVGDMIRPLKRFMPEYRRVEDRVMAVIAERFGLSGDIPVEVRVRDTAILIDERDELLGLPVEPWVEAERVGPLGVAINCWDPQTAEDRYLARLRCLGLTP